MNTQTTNTENGGKGEILAFSFFRKKKWLSAIMALIFLLSSCSPAWASRAGNYGDKDAGTNFLLGGLAGVVTVVSSILNPVGAAAGSVAGDLTGLFMYYNFYTSYGQTIKICG